MFDFSKAISNFHEKHIRLTREQQGEMRRRRETNLDRVVAGLKGLDKPRIVKTFNQGGYAQKTMTQPPEANEESRYDIDLGVVFDKDDACGPKVTRDWVRDAIAQKSSNMKNDPESKSKCVRVIYADGYQCDFPVFRRVTGYGDLYQLASGDEWVDSDPLAMNIWFDREIAQKSPDGDGSYQLRRIVRMLKYFCKTHAHRRGRKFPAGLVATALAVEAYDAREGRDDLSFREALRYLSMRSEYSPVYANGVQVSDDKDVDRIKRLIDESSEAVGHLDSLDAGDVGEADARSAWRKVFRHSFFDEPASKEAAGLSASEKAERMQSAIEARKSEGNAGRPWSN